MSSNVKNETLDASIDSPKEKIRPNPNNNNSGSGSRNNNKRNRRSTLIKTGIFYFLNLDQGGRPSISSREEIDVTKLTQAIFRKRMVVDKKAVIVVIDGVIEKYEAKRIEKLVLH